MISQSTIDNVREIEEADARQYQRRQERERKLDEVKELLIVAGISEDQREMLAEMITRVFIAPVANPY